MSALPPPSSEDSVIPQTEVQKPKAMSLDVLFNRQLQQLCTRILEAHSVEQIMLNMSHEICVLLNADRLTLYAVNDDGTAIVSKIKIGLTSTRELKLPISPQSIAGYVAFSKQGLNLPDVYDEDILERIHPSLMFLKEVDKRSGYRTKQMLAAPIVDGAVLHGVLQIINNKNNVPFGDLEMDGVSLLCKAISKAIRKQTHKLEPVAAVAAVAAAKVTGKYDALVSDGLLSADELAQCIADARLQGTSVEVLLFNSFALPPDSLGNALSKFFGVPYEPFKPARMRIEQLHSALKRDFLLQQGWIPLEDSPEGLVILCTDPELIRGGRVVPQVFPRFVKFKYCVCTELEFRQTLDQIFGIVVESTSIDQMLADMDDNPLDDTTAEDTLESAAADNELVKFVNKVIIDAYHQKVSDIHIEPMPGKQKTGIRFRIDGSLVPYIEVPAHFRQAMVTRLKIMCDLDISERRKPQDGKIKFKKYGPLDIELRVATIPSAGGVEDVVMRILAAGEPIPLEKLGLTAHNKKRLEATVSKPYGLFYVCGPTGSGKTTTLHSILKFLNTPDTKIWTAEDPVEITQKGLRQVQINKKAGIDFALVMRAFLRADPDIIMVGESRDKETVSMGVEASLTGHLVFSTLHTNSAPESITRLMDMGMDPFNFADALLGILAQRLAKKLCDCKESYVPSPDELRTFAAEYAEELRHSKAWKADYEGETRQLLDHWAQTYGGSDGHIRFYRAVGCDKCNKTGFKGRIGLHELLVADDAVKKLIQERARVAELFAASVESGMRTLKMDGMEKVMMGLTDLKMVRSVCIK